MAPLRPSPACRIGLGLVTALLVAACATQGDRAADPVGERVASGETRENARRLCLMRPPAEVDACLRRAEEEFVAREGMRRVDPAPSTGPSPGAPAEVATPEAQRDPVR